MSETTDNLINKTIDSFTNRLKIPLVSTYVIVLIFNSWDIIYYLIFQTGDANTKIEYIKSHYHSWSIVGTSLIYAIVLLVIFTIFDAGLTYMLHRVYKFKKKYADKVNDYKTIDSLNESLNNQIEKYNSLTQDYEKIKELNSNLLSQEKLNNGKTEYTRFGNLISTLIQYNLNDNKKIKSYLNILHQQLNPNSKQGILLSSIFNIYSKEISYDINTIFKGDLRNFIVILGRLEYVTIKQNSSTDKTNDLLIFYNEPIEFLYAQYYIE